MSAGEDPYWAPVLDPGERLLWSGAPAGPPRRGLREAVELGIGALFAVIGGNIAVAGPGPGLYAGSIFVAAGLFLAFGRRALFLRRLRATRYALTDRRALRGRGAVIRSLPIGPGTEIEVEAEEPGTIRIHPPAGTPGGAKRRSDDELNNSPIAPPPALAFQRIAESQRVYRMIRALQTDMAETAR